MLIATAAPASRHAHVAAGMLLIATLAWGLGFTWAKSVQHTLNAQLALAPEAALGPLLMLGVRFMVAGFILLALVPRARSGWSRAGAARAVVLGALLALGMTLQHLGLGRTSEAVSAFLTSLTILFVPLLMTVALRRPPAALLWLAVVLATLGIWLMTGATPAGFGVGELLGLSCAIVFSVHLITLNILVPRDNAWRIVTGQFLVVGVAMLAMCPLVDGGMYALRPKVVVELFAHRDILRYMILLLIFTTLLSFILMTHFQPRLDPSRAALIYLMEPIFAAAYAWVARGRALDRIALIGAALILAANLLVELLNTRSKVR